MGNGNRGSLRLPYSKRPPFCQQVRGVGEKIGRAVRVAVTAAVKAGVSVTSGAVGLRVGEGLESVDRVVADSGAVFCSVAGDTNCGWQAITRQRVVMATRNHKILCLMPISPDDRLLLTWWSVSKALHLVHGREPAKPALC